MFNIPFLSHDLGESLPERHGDSSSYYDSNNDGSSSSSDTDSSSDSSSSSRDDSSDDSSSSSGDDSSDDSSSSSSSSSSSESDDDNTDSSSDDDEEQILAESVALYLLTSGTLSTFSKHKRDRKGNVKRDRMHHLQQIDNWSDELFKRQFRLCREDFANLLESMVQYLGGEEEVKKKEEMAKRSSGSAIGLRTKLMVTLRMLAGASYLDMIWYGVSIESVHHIFKEIVDIIDSCLSNIKIPTTEEAWRNLSDEWSRKCMANKGGDLLPGTVLAGDGLALPIRLPSEEERGNIEAKKYMNRKGFNAVIAQAFCDCNAKFHFFEVSWPGSTNDITCYKQSDLYTKHVRTKKLPSWVHFVLDEAYTSIGGAHHLCPYSKAQLNKAKKTPNVGELLYEKMRAFNQLLSSQRITIERAFGIFLRRWGILWKPLEYTLKTNTQIIRVCAKLHNICVDRNTSTNVDATMEVIPRSQREWRVFLSRTINNNTNEEATNEQIMELFENTEISKERSTYMSKCVKREFLKEWIYSQGYTYDTTLDDVLINA